MGTSRDYYADLELPATADVQEIKKQFRKLALKYHPDRNPGREVEVNAQFQIIQSAHEILSDPQQKAKYDATRVRTGRGGASGVRGNPWSNVGQQFPPPPRRNPNPSTRSSNPNPNPPSGAQRWQTRFSQGVPPTAKQQAQADPEAKKNAAKAFENMRKSQGQPKTGQQARPTPPTPPPRSEYAKQRAEASFGARKAGFQPRSGMGGDEPPVPPRNYSTRSNAERPRPDNAQYDASQSTPMPDPLRKFRDINRDYMDPRQSSPYTTHGGEKTNPFDGVPIGRAKSTRESSHRDTRPSSENELSPGQRHRSSSLPRDSSREETGPNLEVPNNARTPRTADGAADARPKASFRSRTAKAANSSTGKTSFKPQGNNTGGPSMYETPQNQQISPSFNLTTYATRLGRLVPSWTAAQDKERIGPHGSTNESHRSPAPSGSPNPLLNLTPFEREQRLLLDRLIKNMGASASPKEKKSHDDASPSNATSTKFANQKCADSFNFPVDDDTFEQTSPSSNRFAKSSLDDINTSFVGEEESSAWQFSAGSDEQEPRAGSQSQSSSRGGRRSPPKRPTFHRADNINPDAQPTASKGAFNANGWSDKFGPQTFVPQPTPNASASPTRSSRTNSKKAKPVRPTAGSAAIVDDSSSDEETYEWRGRNAQNGPAMAESPQAMDIDSPPRSEQPSPGPNNARNIHVEPSRPDWRPGNVEAVNGEAKLQSPDKTQLDPNAVGSEDTEEFRASFADLKNVAPFAQPKAGLKSFADLKDNLPFESKAAEEVPMRVSAPRPLSFPSHPEAPRLPPTVAIEGMKPNVASWSKYVEDFEAYLQLWDAFNAQVVNHFAVRNEDIQKARSAKGYSFLAARGESDVLEYYSWVQQDNQVRRRWNDACSEHEERFREYMAFRAKMK